MKASGLGLCVASCLLLAVPACRASSLCTAVAGNLVLNCGFETGTFTSWTLSGADVPLQLNNLYGLEDVDPDGIGTHSGNDQAYFGDLDADATTLQQTLATIATDMYTVSFYLAQDTPTVNPYSNEFSVSFGGVLLASLVAVPVEGYTKYSYTGTASSTSSALSFTIGDDLGEFLLDDVSVVQNTAASVTPEPPSWTLVLLAVLGSAFFYKPGLIHLRPQG
jgi:hypothetical protein